MISIRKSGERGHFDHGWLDTYHTFSFAGYQDPEHMGFSVLRVINQDRVQPGEGFGTHPHRDMEIITYVLDGVLEHKDSMGNGSRILPGEVQFMSAGSGITHSEFNGSDSDETHFLQMWMLPADRGGKPRYEQAAFPEGERQGRLRLVVSPDGRDGSITVGQDAYMYAGLFDEGQAAEHTLSPGRSAWLHVARGQVALNGTRLHAGDGAAITDEDAIRISGITPADVVLFDLPA